MKFCTEEEFVCYSFGAKLYLETIQVPSLLAEILTRFHKVDMKHL